LSSRTTDPPPWSQATSATENVWCSVVSTEGETFLTNQSILATSATMESKALLRALPIHRRDRIHQSKKVTCCGGVKACQSKQWRNIYQNSLLKTQPMSRWSIVSADWPHSAQSSESMSPWRCRRSEVQHLSWIASQRKNLCSCGALILHTSLAPTKCYVVLDKYMPD
jgi:hypothetical protein